MKKKTKHQKNPFRILTAIKHSADGIRILWMSEQAFRQEAYLSLILFPIIIFLHLEPFVKMTLVLLLLLLLAMETVNSAIETIVDRISLEIHEQSRNAKDMGSAAVSIVIIMNIVAWIYALYSMLRV